MPNRLYPSIRKAVLLNDVQCSKGYRMKRHELCFRDLEREPGIVTAIQLDVNAVVLIDHLMLQIPASTLAELCNDSVAIA